MTAVPLEGEVHSLADKCIWDTKGKEVVVKAVGIDKLRKRGPRRSRG